MFRFLLSTLLCVNVSLFALENSESAQKNRMLADLNLIKKTFEESYAPAEWKKELFAWDLQGKFQSAVDDVQKSKGNDIKQFQRSLLHFCKSTRDYHVSISFTSTESATLPFDIRYRNGKYIFVHVEKDETLPLNIHVGDEILTMNGVPVKTVVDELQKEMGEENKAATDRALALEILTKRNGRLGHQVPQGSIMLEIKKANSDQTETRLVEWKYKPERVSNPFIHSPSLAETIHFGDIFKDEPILPILEEIYNERSTIPYYEEMIEVFADDELPKDQLGSRKSIFSALGNENTNELGESTTEEQIAWIWKWFWRKKIPESAKEFFDAQLIELPSGKYAGYLRLSTFNEEKPEEALAAFLSCIRYFQNEADMLLIDQTNNPGGNPVYMYALASMLTDHPLVTLKEKKLLSQTDVIRSIEILDFFKDFDLDRIKNQRIMQIRANDFIQGLLDEAKFILDQWEQGNLLTDLYPFHGMEVINPHPRVNFTKPLFILINEKAFSCGDEFPAIFQENKRATIIGTPTAGAGGGVTGISFTNLNGIHQLRYTVSITYRTDGKSLENRGVTPDIYFDFNNELFDKDSVNPNFSKIYDLLDSLTPGSGKKNWSWLD